MITIYNSLNDDPAELKKAIDALRTLVNCGVITKRTANSKLKAIHGKATDMIENWIARGVSDGCLAEINQAWREIVSIKRI